MNATIIKETFDKVAKYKEETGYNEIVKQIMEKMNAFEMDYERFEINFEDNTITLFDFENDTLTIPLDIFLAYSAKEIFKHDTDVQEECFAMGNEARAKRENLLKAGENRNPHVWQELIKNAKCINLEIPPIPDWYNEYVNITNETENKRKEIMAKRWRG